MIYLTTEEIDNLIKEDVPYFDLTGHLLGIKKQKGKISYFTREDAVVCGTEEVEKIFKQLNINCLSMFSSGEKVKKNDILISGEGKSQDLHMAWKVGQNILDRCSGVATKTAKMVKIIEEVSPKAAILTTRKSFPGTKALVTKAILAGGAFPHRLGISETILIFKQHINFIGGISNLHTKISEFKQSCCEKKIIAEAESMEEALLLAKAGVDGIQFDKLNSFELKKAVYLLRENFPSISILAAGGINEDNILSYAQTGVDGIVTSSLYDAKPIDVGVRLELA